MAKVPNAIETLRKISTTWVGRMSVTDDRQTHDKQTDGWQQIANTSLQSTDERHAVPRFSDSSVKIYLLSFVSLFAHQIPRIQQHVQRTTEKATQTECDCVAHHHSIHTWTMNNVQSEQYPSGCNEHTEAQQESSEQPDTSSWIHHSLKHYIQPAVTSTVWVPRSYEETSSISRPDIV